MPSGPPPPTAAGQPPPRDWIILIVDDELDILESTQAVIERNVQGVRTIAADSGRMALEILGKERVDLIVSDFSMPGMDGIEFLFQARRLHPNVPRVMFTAFNNEDLARRAIVDAMVSSFISKTVAPERLVEQLVSLLNYEPAPGVGGAPSHAALSHPTTQSPGRVHA